MAVVPLQIVEPANGAIFAGMGSVRMRGALTGTAPAPLFYKWYSSLAPAPLAASPAPVFDFVAALTVGTQIISFTTKDVPGDDLASIQAVQHAGLAGGPVTPQNPGGCLINVLLAAIDSPTSGATLSKAGATLRAVAPSAWGNADYQVINRVRYIFRFAPSGPPSGRTSADLSATSAQLVFELSGNTPVVRYTGPLPAALGVGNYTLTLRLEDTQNPTMAHEVSRSVVLAA